jgi:fructose-bisphosphate aldolase, class I
MIRNVMPRTRLRQPAKSAPAPDRFYDFHQMRKGMDMTGIYRRLGRLFDATSGRAVILPLDHGVGEGMLPGLEAISVLLGMVDGRNVQGVLLNKGPARVHGADIPLDVNVVVQLSGGTKHALPPYGRTVVCSVGEALRLGADAVSLQINVGNDQEERMLADFGAMCDEAHLAGLPVFAIVAPRGGQIVNETDPSLISHCIRLGAELGADLIGVPYSGEPDSFAEAVEASATPVLVTGGPGRSDFPRFVAAMDEALRCGAAGLCVGRNIFQNADPGEALELLVELVHGARSEADPADEALEDAPQDMAQAPENRLAPEAADTPDTASGQ